MNRRLSIALLLLLSCQMVTIAQNSEEEVIISSNMMEEAEAAKHWVKIKPRYRYIDTLNQISLFTLAIQPNVRKFPETYDFSTSRGYGASIVIAYERLLRDSRFSFVAESATRVYRIEGPGYDYDQKFRYQDSRGNNLNNGGIFDANISTVDVGVKFYYRQAERIRYQVSGKNPFSEYLFLRVRDVLSYSKRTTRVLTQPYRFIESHVEEKKIIVNPGYFQLGWGTQKRLHNRLLLDFHIGFGVKLLGSRNHAYRDLLWDAGLNIGFGFGRRSR